ncbi:MAG: hypothetical protein NVSMB56_04120 [Pyrinomonadaceae bacterium]
MLYLQTKNIWRVAIATPMLFAVIAFGACQSEPANANRAGANSNTFNNTNANANAANNANSVANANASVSPTGATIEAREPEKYRATLIINGETGGDKSITIPALPIEIARNGDARRYSITVPLIKEQFIFLDLADKRYVIEPTRKQYAELTPDTIGFQMPRSLTPGEIIARLQQQRGFERVGDDKRDGRDVVKYRYASSAKTGTKAGEVSSETFVYVDKETGLPVYTELFSTASGDVQGAKNLRLFAEMRDISANVDPTLFALPTDYRKMSPEEVKEQLAAVQTLFQFFIKQVNNK